MELKKPLTFEEQVEKLRSHGMIINDLDFAIQILSEVNYYRLIGYTLQFRKSADNSDYIEGIDLEKIYKLYHFDQELRAILREYIEIVEIYLKTQIANTFAINKCNQSPYDQHYNSNNFYNQEGYKKVMACFNREKNYFKDSLIVTHHSHKYSDKMPLWVMVEFMSFSNVSKFYNSMQSNDQESIAKNIGMGYQTLKNHLHCLSVLRNKCAHTARLYNTEFNPPAKFKRQYLKAHPEIENNSLFAYILILMKRLPNNEDKKTLYDRILILIKEYEAIDITLMGFPKNYQELLKNMIG